MEKYEPDMFYTDGNGPEPFRGIKKSIQLLGGPQVGHKLDADSLKILCPKAMPFQHAVGFKVEIKQ